MGRPWCSVGTSHRHHVSALLPPKSFMNFYLVLWHENNQPPLRVRKIGCTVRASSNAADVSSFHSSTLTFGILTNPYSFLLFIDSSSFISWIRTASVIFLLVGFPKHLLRIFISMGNVPPLWCSTECLHSGLSSFFFSQSSKCSLVLWLVLRPVCPRYLCFTSALSWHSRHIIWYTHPRARQFMPSSLVHIMQFVLLHLVLLKGSIRCSSPLILVPDPSFYFLAYFHS